MTCYLFGFRLSYSGKAVHRIFASAGQEAFFEGHVHALNVLGGVPTGKVHHRDRHRLLPPRHHPCPRRTGGQVSRGGPAVTELA